MIRSTLATPARSSRPSRARSRWLAAACLALVAAQASAQPRAPQRDAEAEGLIVRFKAGETNTLLLDARMQGLTAQARARGLPVRSERSTALGARVLQLDRRLPAASLQAIARELQLYDSSIASVQPNYVLHPAFVPNDAHYASQWNLSSENSGGIRAQQAWESSRGRDVRVAVLDTGALPHADLAANLLPGRDFITELFRAGDRTARDGDATDPGDWVRANDCGNGTPGRNSSWHGTFVAGIVAAQGNNGIGVTGVAPEAKVLPVRVLGRCGGTVADIWDGALWAAGLPVPNTPTNPRPAKILNLSLSGSYACTDYEKDAIQRLKAAGVLVVVAAGNEDEDVSQHAPANCPGAFVVGATTKWGRRASYSNFGAGVHVSAPGGDVSGNIYSPNAEMVTSTSNAGFHYAGADSYTAAMGTSAAAPHVAGVAALMLAANPHLPVAMIQTLIEETAQPFAVDCSGCGKGIVDAERAVRAARGWRQERPYNDTPASAEVMVHMPSNLAGAIQAEGSTDDVDMVLVAAPPRSLLTVDLLNLSPGYDLNLSQLDATGKLFRKASPAGPGQSERIERYNSSFDTTEYWYFKVERGSQSTRTSEAKPYRLRIDRVPVPY